MVIVYNPKKKKKKEKTNYNIPVVNIKEELKNSNKIVNKPKSDLKANNEIDKRDKSDNLGTVYRDKKGNLGAIEVNGKIYGGLSSKEIRQIAEAQRKKYETPEGFIEASVLGKEQKKQRQLEQIRQAQSQELQTLQDRFLSQEEAPTFKERMAKSGSIVLTQVGNLLTGKNRDPYDLIQEYQRDMNSDDFLTKIKGNIGYDLALGAGVVSNIGAGSVKISSLFSNFGDAMENLKGDASKLSQISRDILRNVRDGASPTDAVAFMENLETGARLRYKNAQENLKKSPKDIAEALDINDEIYQNLIKIVSRKQIIQRYALTGDTSELDRELMIDNMINQQA